MYVWVTNLNSFALRLWSHFWGFFTHQLIQPLHYIFSKILPIQWLFKNVILFFIQGHRENAHHQNYFLFKNIHKNICNGLPTQRYVLKSWVFSRASQNSANSNFCQKHILPFHSSSLSTYSIDNPGHRVLQEKSVNLWKNDVCKSKGECQIEAFKYLLLDQEDTSEFHFKNKYYN